MTLGRPTAPEDVQAADAAEDAVEALDAAAERRLLLICEHASERLPPGWSWPDEDRWLIGTHWALDLGAAEVTRALARELGCAAILARFSRLLVDPNRDPGASTLFRDEAEGRPVRLNLAIDEDDRRRRLDGYYHPYHRRIDRALAGAKAAAILSVHSFTPVYEGRPRAVEIGVLYERHPELATAFAEVLRGAGLRTELNEPYSGILGFAYSPERHAAVHGRRCLELEIRQDLAVDPGARSAIEAAILAAIRATFFAEAT